MARLEVSIKTRDGVCQASIFVPEEKAKASRWPGTIFFMDGLGIRPVLWEMGQRLADAGYVVLMPDLFYRLGAYAPIEPAAIFADPGKRAELMKMIGSLDRDKKIADAGAFLEFLAGRAEVRPGKFGAVGYCMGGNCCLTAAGAFPDRFAAVASFHGGNLATEKPESPHLFLKGFQGKVYVGGAIEDGSFPEEQKVRLEKALKEASVPHVVETYAGAKHGWAIPDLPAYNEAAAERHWRELWKLFAEMVIPHS